MELGDDGAEAPRWSLEAATRFVDGKIADFFAALGALCARRPKKVLAVSVCAVLLCSVGLSRFTINSNDDTLYLPEDAPSIERNGWIGRTFVRAKTEKSSTFYVFGTGAAHKNVLRDREALRALFGVHEKIVAAEDGHGRTLYDCGVTNHYGNKVWLGPLGYWNYSRDAFEADDDWRGTLARPRAVDWYGITSVNDGKVKPQETPLTRVLGDFEIVDGAMVSASAIQFMAKLVGDCPDSVSRAGDAAVEAASPARGVLDVFVHSHTSYRDAVLDALKHDLTLVLASLALLVAFASVCFGVDARTRGDAVGPRALLGGAALASVLLALAAAFGLWMAFGGYFQNLMAAAIFMTLGLGVDDAFVVVDAVDAVDDDDDDLSVEEAAANKLGEGLRTAGASILLTSCTDAAAFAACAATSNIPAVTSFCGVALGRKQKYSTRLQYSFIRTVSTYSFDRVAALCVACDFLLQVTFFAALLALDVRRGIARKRRFGAAAPLRARGAAKGPCAAVAQFVTRRECRLVVAGLVVVLLALGVAGASKLEMEYETQWMAPDDSSARRAYAVEEQYFLTSNVWFVDAYSRHASPSALYDHYESYVAALRKLDALKFNGLTKSWVAEFDAYRTAFNASWSDEAGFDAAIRDFRAHHAGHYGRELVAYENGGGGVLMPGGARTAACTILSFRDGANGTDSVCASKIPMSWKKVNEKSTQMRRLDEAQALLDAHGAEELGLFVQRSAVLEALALTWPQTVKSVGYVALTVFLTCLLLLGRASAAALMLGVMAFVDVVLIGALYWIGEYCNMITAVILTLAIGLAVDFSAHVTHAYFHAESASSALARMLPPILKAGGSTLLAVLPMAFSQSYVIRLFFAMSLMIISLGLFVGLLVVPAALQTADDVALYRNRRDLENRLRTASYAHDDGFAGGGHDYIGDSYHLIDDEPGGDDTRRASRLRVMELCDTGG
ncbi:hypothetical protein AURANDRAFT_63945 [Aureococcus anophagefferens]|uniref:SSD domain-containing protein n=1 Tax=Aureococcus anophagefferens TaxID=44056 RepID=F0Y8C2_AURAN|nr:hypothetical protein AURANDRAFT_63945 [Aureococcus anophagefferens]EGB08580.1 hypothetical protein AURANDRAFT_63945 [Aureococcus anophagefferens]|eukprot:XP_009036583.1 hypothetical protein AURANDRAFT_63945 [Aureococcus anophagefferens]